jgi:hypothetical protein
MFDHSGRTRSMHISALEEDASREAAKRTMRNWTVRGSRPRNKTRLRFLEYIWIWEIARK